MCWDWSGLEANQATPCLSAAMIGRGLYRRVTRRFVVKTGHICDCLPSEGRNG